MVEEKSGILQKLPAYEQFRTNKTNSYTRVDNVDLLETGDEGTIGLCHLIDMNRHSHYRNGERVPFYGKGYLEMTAAVALATEHLNTGNGVVIDEVQDLNQYCPIRFTNEFMDTAGSETQAVDAVMDLFQRENDRPCAFIGALRSQVSIPTALLTSLKGYAQVSAFSTAAQLNDKELFPYFGRLIPTNDQYAIPLLQYVQDQLGVQHLCVIHIQNDTGNSYAQGIVREASTRNMEIQLVGFPPKPSPEDIQIAINEVKSTRLRYVFAIVSGEEFEPLLLEAYDQGIAGNGDYAWMVSNFGAPQKLLLGQNFTEESPLRKASVGLITFSVRGSLPGIGRYEEFVESWKELANPIDTDYLQTKVPQYDTKDDRQVVFDNSVFEDISLFTPLVYDTTIALGLAACRAASNANHTSFTGEEQYQALLQTSFEGASGVVSLDPQTGSREASSALFVLSNFVPAEVGRNRTVSSFQENQVAYYYNGTWIEERTMTFNDGTNIAPKSLPEDPIDYNYIGTGLRVAGLVMAGIIILLSLSFSIWTFAHRKSRVVRASQGIFLHLICFGTFLLGTSLIVESFDDEIVSSSFLNVSCMLSIWLASLGWCCAFCALFTKVMRVNKIFQNPRFSRVQVTVCDVMKPMAFMMTANIIILSLWTALDPMVWNRVTTGYNELEMANESEGNCTAPNMIFVILLIVLDFGVLTFAVFQSYRARQVAVEFSESAYIAGAMGMILVVFFVAIPVFFLVERDPRATFFVKCAMVFVVSVALLVFIFVPKIVYHHSKQPQRTHSDAVKASLPSSSVRVSSLPTTTNSRSSTQRNSTSDSSADEEGCKIMEHPKLRQDLNQRIQDLEKDNGELSTRVSELESLLLQKASSATTENVLSESPTAVEEKKNDGDDDHV